jgi:hypothetical protein
VFKQLQLKFIFPNNFINIFSLVLPVAMKVTLKCAFLKVLLAALTVVGTELPVF